MSLLSSHITLIGCERVQSPYLFKIHPSDFPRSNFVYSNVQELMASKMKGPVRASLELSGSLHVQGKDPKIPNLLPNCAALEPPPCTITYSKNPKTGDYTFDYYLETCPNHQCTLVSPVDEPDVMPAKIGLTSKNTTLAAAAPSGVLPQFRDRTRKKAVKTQPLSAVPYSTIDEDGAFIRPSTYWFCQSFMVGYTARVEKGTGLAPGEKEDQWAQCQWARFKIRNMWMRGYYKFLRHPWVLRALLQSLVGLGTDCNVERQGCAKCWDAYQIFICSIAFPKCQPATGGLASNGNDVYGPDTLSLDQQKNLMYTITKSCRTNCFHVVRMCDIQVDFTCHLKETRDFADYPGCNVAGNPMGGVLYV